MQVLILEAFSEDAEKFARSHSLGLLDQEKHHLNLGLLLQSQKQPTRREVVTILSCAFADLDETKERSLSDPACGQCVKTTASKLRHRIPNSTPVTDTDIERRFEDV